MFATHTQSTGRIFPLFAWALTAAVCLSAMPADAGGIRDDAGLFTPSVVSTTQAKLNALQENSGHDVTIETHARVPEDRAKSLKGLTASEKSKLYSDWLKHRAKETKAEGIFVLITKEPGHVEVGVSGKLQKAGYTPANKKAVVDSLLTAFRAKDYDSWLTETVALIEQQYGGLTVATPTAKAVGQTAPVTAPSQSPAALPSMDQTSWVSILVIVGAVMLGLMLLTTLLRALAGGFGGGMGGGMGGGGFGTGLLGGLFGAMAGSWLYDSFMNTNSAHAGDTGLSSAENGASAGGHDGWSTSGGDFGGGDFGGGDFGGGDFGGGGDF